jgi:hypothetical protein
VSYLINKLQPLPFETPVVVTLNPAREPDPAKVIAEFDYAHPIFDAAAIAAQQRLAEVQGEGGVWLAGAWGSYGFHEDGLKSALRVVNGMGVRAPWQGEPRPSCVKPRQPEAAMNTRPQLCLGHVMHRRLRPAVNAFVYPVFYVQLPLRPGGGGLRHLLGRQRNLLSFRSRITAARRQPAAAVDRGTCWRAQPAGRWRDRAADLPARARLRLQPGQLLVLPRPQRRADRHPGRGEQHLRRQHSYLLHRKGERCATARK